jgi:REP element-mobilizing transposase RayT
MSHTYCCALFHCVFSTKERRESLTPKIQTRLWPYLGGIAREHSMKALAIGGSPDHVHILLSLSSSKALAQGIREIKSASSHWMRATCGVASFEWQEGYGAFSIGQAQVNATMAYIARQEEHHRTHDFQGELLAFLKKHNVDYDPRYVLG